MNNINKNLEILSGIKIAHRGLWNIDNPENSIGAYKRCIDKNIPIELDVHILKDNTLVVFHDSNTLRMTGENLVLKKSNYEDIKKLRLKDTKYEIPTFSSVLDLVDGKVLLDIEIKYDVKSFRICRELCKFLDSYKGSFIVKSFNPIYLVWFRIFRPNYVRGLLLSGNDGKDISNNLWFCFLRWFNVFMKIDFLAFDCRYLPNENVDKIKESGIPVLIFTIKKGCEIEYRDYGYIYEE